MNIHPNLDQHSGVLSVTLQAQFTGADTDAPDRAKISAYGDPLVNLAGSFVDPLDPTFKFSTASPVVFTGITTDMHNHPIQFLTTPPAPIPGKLGTSLTPLQVVTPDPIRAAGIWNDAIKLRLISSMTTLRALASPITSLPDSTV